MRKLPEQYNDMPERPSKKQIAQMSPKEIKKHNDKVLEVMNRAEESYSDRDEYERFMYNIGMSHGTVEQKAAVAKFNQGAHRAEEALSVIEEGKKALILTKEQQKMIRQSQKNASKYLVKVIQKGLRD